MLSVIRCWFMDVGWSLVGCSVLVVECWLMLDCCWLFVCSYCVMILDCLLFGLLLVGCCLCVVGCFFVVIV